MSLPPSKPAQLSIRSFFQAKAPKYAPPPSSRPANPPGAPPPPPPAGAPSAPPLSAVAPEQPAAAATDDTTPPVTSPPATATSTPPLPANLPREADVRPVTGDDVNALRRINALLLPVNYPDSFYRRAIEGLTSRVITWAHDGAEPKVVGGVVCRLEPDLIRGREDGHHHNHINNDGTVSQTLYIQSLCLLSPYRGMGLIQAAVDNIVAAVAAEPDLAVADVTAHVWTENEDGLKWYQGRGFRRDDAPIRGYYMKLRPDTAWLVRRPVGAFVLNALPGSTTTTTSVSQAASRPVPPGATASVVNLPPMSGPPRAPNAPPLPRTSSGRSYQNQRADMEWNDLPEDMAAGRLQIPGASNGGSGGGGTPTTTTTSLPSSRSSSTARKKRDRAYPAAAFGN